MRKHNYNLYDPKKQLLEVIERMSDNQTIYALVFLSRMFGFTDIIEKDR